MKNVSEGMIGLNIARPVWLLFHSQGVLQLGGATTDVTCIHVYKTGATDTGYFYPYLCDCK